MRKTLTGKVILSEKLIRIIVRFLLLGMAMYVVPEWYFLSEGAKLKSILLSTVQHLGEAFVIASLVGFMFERLMGEERLKEMRRISGMMEKFDKLGFKDIYDDRQEVFNKLFQHNLQELRGNLRIMGICVSLFRETDRASRAVHELTSKSLIGEIVSAIIERKCEIEVLYLRRYPRPEELQRYSSPAAPVSSGSVQADLYYMREWDEDGPNFWGGKRLRKIANQSIGDWIKVYLELAKRTKALSEEDRREVIQRLKLKEYLALPSLSLYIADDDMYVTPYLHRRHCSSVPAFWIGGKSKPLYQSYYGHFDKIWNDDTTCWTLPYEFLEILIKDPGLAVASFEKKYRAIREEHMKRAEHDETYRESPEFAMAEEETVSYLVGQVAGTQAKLY